MLIAGSLWLLPDFFRSDDKCYIITKEVPDDCPTPIIVYSGDLCDMATCKFEVFVEGCLVAQPVDIMEAYEVLVSCYYVFDIPYHKKASCTMIFLQKGLLKLSDSTPMPASVRSLLNQVSAETVD